MERICNLSPSKSAICLIFMKCKQLNQCTGFPTYLKLLGTILYVLFYFERTVCRNSKVVFKLNCDPTQTLVATWILQPGCDVTVCERQCQSHKFSVTDYILLVRGRQTRPCSLLVLCIIYCILCQSLIQDRPTRFHIMLHPSDKLAIELKLMSN